MARKVEILQFQVPVGMAIQEYGSVEGVFLLMQDNPTLTNVSTPLTPGNMLNILSKPVDREVAAYYTTNALHPVSGPVIDVTVPGAFNQDFNEDFNNNEVS